MAQSFYLAIAPITRGGAFVFRVVFGRPPVIRRSLASVRGLWCRSSARTAAPASMAAAVSKAWLPGDEAGRKGGAYRSTQEPWSGVEVSVVCESFAHLRLRLEFQQLVGRGRMRRRLRAGRPR